MATSETFFQIGPWAVDPAALTLERGDATVHVRPKVMELLLAFTENPGEVLSKTALLDLVWPDVTVGDASLTVAVRELREALGDKADRPTFIETIPRRGYRLIAPVEGAVLGRPRSMGGGPTRFWLIGRDARFALVEGANVIGRASDADVCIPSTKVSRHHARIVVDGDTAFVEDLGSKNGTYVGGLRVDRPTSLGHDDELQLGQMAVALRVVVIGRESTVTEASHAVFTD